MQHFKAMFRTISAILSATLLCTIAPIQISAAQSATEVMIYPENELQSFRGWGTSLSWWGNAVGNWADEAKKDEILDLLFDPDSGLGLNVVRYNIGGGDDPTHTHMRNGAQLEGYEPSPGVWNDQADATQRSILNGAMARGANIVEGFAKTPPYWMTYSGCASGNTDGTSNLKPEYYDDYAAYLAHVYTIFRDTYGITFDSVSPINEPNGPWWVVNNRQEGCHYTTAEQNELFKTMRTTFDAQGLSNVVLAGPEGFEFNSTLNSWNSFDGTARAAIGKINTHSYYGTERLFINTIAACGNKRLSVSEYGVGVGDHNHEAVESSLALARKIRDDVAELRPETWVYWQAVEEEFNVNNWGFIHAAFDGNASYTVTKQYYGMANFSKFIRPGSIIIGTDNSNMLAALNKNNNQLVIVAVNDSTSAKSYTFNLSKFFSHASTAQVYRTSASENLAQLADITITGDQLSYTAEPQTISTIVIHDAATNISSQFSPSHLYRIINKDDNSKVLDVRDSSPDNSADIIVMNRNDASISQGWKFISDGKGNYYIANANAAKMLDVPGASKKNSVSMKLWQPNGDNNQLWSVGDLGNGYYRIINVNSGKALGVKNGTMTEGNVVDQYDYNAYENQQWKFEQID